MSKNVTNNRKIIWEWNKPLGNKDKPYAYRWRLDFYWFSFRVHKWICSDDNRAYHSHPVNMLIFILRGAYDDVSPREDGGKRVILYSAFDIRYIKRDYKHFVRILKNPTWTFLITWGQPKRWAFWNKISLKKKNRDRYFLEHGHYICE